MVIAYGRCVKVVAWVISAPIRYVGLRLRGPRACALIAASGGLREKGSNMARVTTAQLRLRIETLERENAELRNELESRPAFSPELSARARAALDRIRASSARMEQTLLERARGADGRAQLHMVDGGDDA